MADWAPEGARPLAEDWAPEGARALAEHESLAPQVGAGETFVNSASSALPLGQRAVDAISTGIVAANKPKGVHLSAKARAEAKALGVELPEDSRGPGLLDTYRNIRDTRAERIAAGSEQNPVTSGLGTALGVGLSLAAPLPKVAVGSGASGRVISNAATAGGYGAANSLANGGADLTKGELLKALSEASGVEGLQMTAKDWKAGNKGRALLDLLGSGAIGGAAGGALLSGTMEGGRSLLAAKAAPSIRNTAISAGRRVLTNGADSLSKRNPIAEPAVEEAIRSGAIKPFGNNAGTYERLQELSGAEADKYRDIISKLEAHGVRGPRASAIADQLMGRATELESRTGANKAIPNAYVNEAANAESLAGEGGTLGLKQSEDVKRALQREAKYGRFEETPLNEAKRDIASVYRAANEKAIEQASSAAGEGSPVHELGSQFVPTKQRLGNLLTAEEAARRGAARGAQRGHFGPMEAAAAASEVAAGHPGMALPAGLAMKLFRGRGPSTTASYGLRLSDALATNPDPTGKLGYIAAQIAELRRRGVPVIDIPTPHGESQ